MRRLPGRPVTRGKPAGRSTPITLCVLIALTLMTACTGPPIRDPGPGPSGNSTSFPCPSYASPTSDTPRAALRAGRVHVGKVSYPAAPGPYRALDNHEYLPFANRVGSQRASVEASSSASMGWQSVVALARLSSVDGAWGGPRAAEVVSQCSLSVTWRGIDYHPVVSRDQATTVDGHEAWVRVTDLSFTVPGVKTTKEVQTVLIVQAGDESYAYLSYLPNSAPDLAPLLDATRTGLRVD